MRNRIMKVIVMAFAIIVFLSSCGKKEIITEEEQTYSDDKEYTVNGQEIPEPVIISMPEYEVAYSGILKEVINYTEVEENGKYGLSFTVSLSNIEAPIFTMYYQSNQGEIVEMIKNGSGDKIPIAFRMDEIPTGLSEEDEQLFYSAQEAVNDIIASISLK